LKRFGAPQRSGVLDPGWCLSVKARPVSAAVIGTLCASSVVRYNPVMAIRSSYSWRQAGWWALGLSLGWFAWCGPSAGQAPLRAAERRAVLEAIRPQAASRAGQAVKFRVERLNVDGDWALLTGELVSTAGGPLDWAKAKECHRELDKLLWVVLSRRAGRWQVKHLEVCATEPAHWSLEQFGGFVWPCGVYAGLQGPSGEDLQLACLGRPANRAPRP
jgi:hypothetical protein